MAAVSSRWRAVIVAQATLLLLGCLLPSTTSASIECRYDAASHVLSVITTAKGLVEDESLIRRVGDRIAVSALFGPGVNCHGAPTVTNTDRIKARTRGFGEITISLAGGPFAPGATPEADSSSEIEIALSGLGSFWLGGSPGADRFRYMSTEGQSGLNLNAGPEDEDVDLLTPNPEAELFVLGGSGPDTIDVVPPVSVEVAAFGGPGDDTLIGAKAGGFGGVLLEGEGGRDRIVGSPLADLLLPGAGADVVKGEGGSDEIGMRPDKRRDRIDCGEGRDSVSRPDRIDRLRSCETVKERR